MSEIEQDIIKKTGFKPAREYKDRQDYLAALVRAAWNADDSVFKQLTDEATAWVNAGEKAVRSHSVIAELPDVAQEVYNEVVEATVELDETPENTPYPEPAKPKRVKVKLTGKIDRYGCSEGSKNNLALKMFERGATMKQVIDALGKAKYNILRKQEEAGHRVVREVLSDGIIKITLTHKDDVK